MKRVISVFVLAPFVLLFLAINPAAAVPMQNAAQPSAVTPAPPPDRTTADGAKTDYSKEPYIIEQMKTVVRFESDGTGKQDGFLRVKVQSESGVRQWGQLQFGYNSANQRMEIPVIRVLKPDGTVVTAGADAVQDLSAPIERMAPVYTDYRQKHVTVPGLRPGDTLECQLVTTTHTALAEGQFWSQYEFISHGIVLDEQLEVNVPGGRPVKVKTRPGLDPKTTEENDRKIYRWTSSHLVNEDDDKKDKDSDKDKKKKKKKPEDEQPAVQLTTFSSWEEVGRWYAGLEKDRRVPSAAVRAKADELTKGLTTDLDKVEALYDFTAKNFRYVSLSLGMGRYQPHSADDVLHNQYGDCKDKHTLLESLLDAEGMHASSVLINSRRKLDPDMPSPSQFDHVITLLPLGKEEVWMDTTAEIAPFRLLYFGLRKKQALVVPANGAAHLEETPADAPMLDTENFKIEGKVDDTGTLDAQISYRMRGDSEILWRQGFRNVSSAQWQDVAERMSSAEGLGKDVSEVKVSDTQATREAFTFSYHVSKPGFLDWSKKKLEVKLPLRWLGLANADPDDADSPDPIKLGPKADRTYNLRLEMPARFVAHLPLPLSVKRDYGEYESSYKLEGSVFITERKMAMHESELPSARVQDYLSFRHAVATDLTQQLNLETTVAGTPSVPSNMKAADLVRDGNTARKDGNYSLAIDLLNRAVGADPKNKTAWNDLGIAYFEDQQDGLAINAYQKQIEVNAYDENAYNNLGRVYLRQRKYDEAEKWFNKQIEINPLDKYAHNNLGLALLETHKYEDAVPELERAVSLTPNSADPQVRLGEAYLNLGQDDKAMAAFDQAVKISATAGVWNNIAYQLALRKTHTDIARRYAESAVTTTAVALRNVTVAQLTPRDLGWVSALANYWDTLGWVEFDDGNLDKAQKYILASWQLGQRSSAAHHLGQIYEKKGDKDQAVYFHALALNSYRPEPEVRETFAKLVGGDAQLEALTEKYRSELLQLRTIKVANPSKLSGKADFFLLWSSSSGGHMAIDGVKFISGEEKLKTFADALHSAKYDQTLPDDTAVKLVRRGTLVCVPEGDCKLELAAPADVKSVD